MPETSRTRKRRRWPKVLGLLLGIFVVLLAAVYFLVSNETVLQRYILPRVSDAINADVTVSGASINPFSKVVLKDLKVHPRGREPLLTAQEVRLRYSFLALLGGRVKVDEAVMAVPVLEIVTRPDGTSNLDPILQSQDKEAEKRQPSDEPSDAPRLDLRNVSLVNGTVRHVQQLAGNKREVVEVGDLNVTIADVRSGQTGKLTLSSLVKMDTTNGVLQAKSGGDFSFALSRALKPAALQGEARFEVQQATGGFSAANGLNTTLVADATPEEIRHLVVRFLKDSNPLGEIRVEGPFEMAKTEGRLNVQVISIDRQVLSLVGGHLGFDFGKTLINSSNRVQLARSGKVVTVNGAFHAAQVTLQSTNATTPALDLMANYDLTVDTGEKTAKLRTLGVNGTQNGKRVLHLGVPNPMTITWGEVVVPTGDSALNLEVTDLNLADWKPFLATLELPLGAGMLNLTANLTSQESGKQLRLDATGQVTNASIAMGTNVVSDAGLMVQLRGTLSDLMRLKISQLQAQVAHQGEAVLTVKVTGQYDRQSLTSDLQLAVEGDVPRLLQLAPPPDTQAKSGTLQITARLRGSQQAQSLTGAVAVVNFTGELAEYRFDQYDLAARVDVQKTDQAMEVRSLTGSITEGQQPGGAFAISGTYRTNGAGQFTVKLDGLNENALEPFLGAMLDDKQLVSVTLDGSANLQYEPAGSSAIKTDIQLAKLVVADPEKKIPATPLEARVQLESTLHQHVVEIKQAQIGLTPTPRAKNAVNVTGRLDLNNTNALEGALKVQADSLDLTAYYDIFAGKGQPAAAGPPGPQPAAATPPTAGGEPEAIQMPVRRLDLEVQLGRMYLRELDIANLRAAPHVEGSHVRTGPIQLSVNGAPVKGHAELNLGVPGYRYALTTSIDRMPLEPLVNTFKPEQQGRMKGDLTLAANITGAGTTGTNLKKHLNGEVRLDLTNGNVQVASTRFLSNLVTVVALTLNTPELTESPLQGIQLQSEMGNGQIQVNNAQFVSALFAITTGGSIQLADVLTNSIIQSWPVSVALRDSLAGRVRPEFLQSAAPGSAYVPLVNFVRIDGPVSDPRYPIDKRAIAGFALEQIGQRIGNKQTQELFKGLGGLLGGRQTGTNAPNASTNAPSTNRTSPFNPLLDLIKPKQ